MPIERRKQLWSQLDQPMRQRMIDEVGVNQLMSDLGAMTAPAEEGAGPAMPPQGQPMPPMPGAMPPMPGAMPMPAPPQGRMPSMPGPIPGVMQ